MPLTEELKDKLTAKVGPLPAWGWAAAIIGGYAVYRLFHSSSSTSTSAGTSAIEDLGAGGSGGTPPDDGSGSPPTDGGGGGGGGTTPPVTVPPIIPPVTPPPSGGGGSGGGGGGGGTTPTPTPTPSVPVPSTQGSGSLVPSLTAAQYAALQSIDQLTPGGASIAQTPNQTLASGEDFSGLTEQQLVESDVFGTPYDASLLPAGSPSAAPAGAFANFTGSEVNNTGTPGQGDYQAWVNGVEVDSQLIPIGADTTGLNQQYLGQSGSGASVGAPIPAEIVTNDPTAPWNPVLNPSGYKPAGSTGTSATTGKQTNPTASLDNTTNIPSVGIGSTITPIVDPIISKVPPPAPVSTPKTPKAKLPIAIKSPQPVTPIVSPRSPVNTPSPAPGPIMKITPSTNISKLIKSLTPKKA